MNFWLFARLYEGSFSSVEVTGSAVEKHLHLETGREETFTVTSLGVDILAIQNVGGYVLPRHTPTWSEVAESWHIDKEFAEATESDEPCAAALAGYLHPEPYPNSAGHGLRRAA